MARSCSPGETRGALIEAIAPECLDYNSQAWGNVEAAVSSVTSPASTSRGHDLDGSPPSPLILVTVMMCWIAAPSMKPSVAAELRSKLLHIPTFHTMAASCFAVIAV
jgi:hypothetical protein